MTCRLASHCAHARTRCAVLLLSLTMLAACSVPDEQSQDQATAPSPQVAQGPASETRAQASEERARIAPLAGSVAKRTRAEFESAAVAPAPAVMPPDSPHQEPDDARPTDADTERYKHLDENPVHRVSEQPVSTFSIDVDTGAYANVRRFLVAGQLPPRDAVRVEELINYFPYDYAPPSAGERPFAVHTEVAPSPWNADTHLLRIALKGQQVAKADLPPANLVFLIDVSGSMSDSNKLPLLKSAFKSLTRELRARDRVSLVVYAGASGVVLEPTAGDDRERILTALERLSAGGSTHGAAGIELAYAVARRGFIPGGINRVLLATDGDFNVGITNFERLKNLIEEKRRSGISLSTLGFGTGNYNDQLMEQLADAGNGNYSYIDTPNEGRKVLIEELSSTLHTIASDVKIQVEFNPANVSEYRLIGYENRALRREDFNNDRVDAGEIGAGHAVTALYEIRLAGKPGSLIDPLRYRAPADAGIAGAKDELALLRLRYKQPGASHSQLHEVPILSRDMRADLTRASAELRFAASVAAFGQLLRGGRHLGPGAGSPDACNRNAPAEGCADPHREFDYAQVEDLARGALSADPFGYRAEYLDLVGIARRLSSGPDSPRAALDQVAR